MNPFASGSRFAAALLLATDLVLLNLAMVLTGLPVVTAGAGLTAGLVVCLQMVAGTSSRPMRQFVEAFRRTFVPATIVWLGVVGLGVLLVWEWVVAGRLALPIVALVARTVVLVTALLLGLVGVWFWPLLALRMNEGDRVGMGEIVPLLQTALLAGLKHLPRSLAGLVIVAAPLLVGLLSVEIGARMIIWFVLIGLALAAYLLVLLVRGPLGVELATAEDD